MRPIKFLAHKAAWIRMITVHVGRRQGVAGVMDALHKDHAHPPCTSFLLNSSLSSTPTLTLFLF